MRLPAVACTATLVLAPPASAGAADRSTASSPASNQPCRTRRSPTSSSSFRSRPVAGRDVRGPLRREARGPRPRGVWRRPPRGAFRRRVRGAGLPRRRTHRGRRRSHMTGRAVASATRGRRAGGAVTLESGARAEIEKGDELPEIVVMASGCLGLVSFPREPGRVTLERLTDRYPGLLAALLEHPRHRLRARAFGGSRRGRPRRTGDQLPRRGPRRGRRPARAARPHAAAHVLRTDGFAHCPDLLVNAGLSADTEDVAAFEELVGSHGGMGGSQSFRSSCSRARCPTPRTRWSVPSGCIA
jgi:hypothetical protein